MNGTISFLAKPSKIRAFVSRHPLIAIIILAYNITWIASILLRFDKNGSISGMNALGAAGPALAAMAVSAMLKPEPSGIPARKRWIAFCVSLVMVLAVLFFRRFWFAAGLVTIPGRSISNFDSYLSPVAFLSDIVGASFMAFVISGAFAAHRGVHELLHSLNPQVLKTGWYWLVIAVGAYPAVILCGNALSAIMGVEVPGVRATGSWYWIVVDAVWMFLYVLFCGGGFEEPGWRGFALPILQQKYSPVVASLILGVIWAFWHWPEFWAGEYLSGVFQVLVFTPSCIQFTIFLTALYKWTGGSLPAVILWHTTFNISASYLPMARLGNLLWLLLCIALAIWMWRKPQTFRYTRQNEDSINTKDDAWIKS